MFRRGRGAQWQARRQERAVGARADGERPAGQPNPLFHAEQAEVTAASAGAESLAVVLHLEPQLAILLRVAGLLSRSIP